MALSKSEAKQLAQLVSQAQKAIVALGEAMGSIGGLLAKMDSDEAPAAAAKEKSRRAAKKEKSAKVATPEKSAEPKRSIAQKRSDARKAEGETRLAAFVAAVKAATEAKDARKLPRLATKPGRKPEWMKQAAALLAKAKAGFETLKEQKTDGNTEPVATEKKAKRGAGRKARAVAAKPAADAAPAEPKARKLTPAEQRAQEGEAKFAAIKAQVDAAVEAGDAKLLPKLETKPGRKPEWVKKAEALIARHAKSFAKITAEVAAEVEAPKGRAKAEPKKAAAPAPRATAAKTQPAASNGADIGDDPFATLFADVNLS